jgi:ABC-type siderophore export system fused ATPase/permease subunit
MTFVALGSGLEAPVVFTALVVLLEMRIPLKILNVGLLLMSDFLVSLRKFDDFFIPPPFDAQGPAQEAGLEAFVLPAGASVGWGGNFCVSFPDPELRIAKGAFVGVSGEVGSGKTCLLLALAGLDDAAGRVGPRGALYMCWALFSLIMLSSCPVVPLFSFHL